MTTGSEKDALQSALRQAVLENDPARIETLLDGQKLDDDFHMELIGGVIAAGDHAPLIKRLVQEAGDKIAPTGLMNFLASAARQGHRETAAYFVEKCLEANVPHSDCVNRVTQNAPPEKIGAVAVRISQDAEDGKRVLSEFMLFSATAKKYDALGALADAGATMGGHGSVILMMMLNEQIETFADIDQKPTYFALMDKLISKACDDKNGLDLLLPLVAYKMTAGTSDPSFMDSLTRAGADPFYMGAEAYRHLSQTYLQNGQPQRADHWKTWFDDRQSEYTNACRQQFDMLFGQDFRVQDLLRTETENGENGLMLAARARRIPELLRAAEKTGDLDIAALLAENKHKQSLLSLTIDRGDVAVLLKPAYWSRFDTDMVSLLERKLGDDQKKWMDMDAITAQFDHFYLESMAKKWHTPQSLRPRARS